MQRTAAASMRKYTPVQLAFWPDERRAIANELARCALFRCGSTRKPRQQFDNHSLFVLGSGKVTYTGEELRSLDEDLFMALAHAARRMSVDCLTVKLSNAQICKLTGRHQSQVYYNEIFRSIQRMRGGTITVFSARLTKALACEKAREEGAAPEVLYRLFAELAEFERREALKLLTPNDKITGVMMSLIEGDPVFTNVGTIVDNIPQGNLQWEIMLNKKLVMLFAEAYLTHIDFEARKELSPGARRLQSYFSSHRNPNDVLVSSLAQYVGLELSSREEVRTIQRYLDELVKVGILETGVIVPAARKGSKLVQVTRPTTKNDTQEGQNDPPAKSAELKTTHNELKSNTLLLKMTP
jgi:hypothetical protein